MRGRPNSLRAREIVPGFEEAGNVVASSYEALGKYEEAAAIIAQQPCWGVPMDGLALAEAFRAGGPEAYWRKRLELMPDPATMPPLAHFARAIVHRYLGHTDEALHHVECMVDAHLGACVFLGVDANLAVLRSHPRYQAVLSRVGVGPQQMASAAHTAST